MSKIDQVVDEISNMPLFDAAYYLAANVGQLSREERGEEISMHRQPVDDRDDLGSHARVEAGEYNSAGNKETLPNVNFDLLSKAHPEASEEDIKVAFRAAAKLSQDAIQYFSYGSDYIASVTRATDLARRANPGFQEQTYRRVSNRLAFSMR